jgi:hypothetical protein
MAPLLAASVLGQTDYKGFLLLQRGDHVLSEIAPIIG